MQNSQLDRLLRLIKRTGDKAVVVDRASEHMFMLMDLDAYEDLFDAADGNMQPRNNNGPTREAIPVEADEEVTTRVPLETVVDLPVINVDIPVEADPLETENPEDRTKEEPEIPSEENALEDYILDDLLDTEDKKSVQPVAEEAPLELPLENDEVPETETTPEPQPEVALRFEETWPEVAKNAVVSEESLQDVPAEEEEEKFYLEPVE